MENSLTITEGQAIQSIGLERIEHLVERFIADQDVKPQSRNAYRRTIRQFFLWIERKGFDLRSLTRSEILQYKNALQAEGKSSLTAASYLTSVKLFYAWLEALKIYPNIARGVRMPKRIQQHKKQPLTSSQSTELLAHFKAQARRDYAIVNLLLRTGLRTIEVIRADVNDLTTKGGRKVLMVQGKGRDEKDAFVILTDKAYQPIADYLTERNAQSGEPLFISESNNNGGGRLTTRTISFLAKEGLKAIGLNDKAYTAHSLRHTTAVSILRAGGTLEDAQGILRHSSPATTQIYTATIKEERRLERASEALIDSLY